VRAWALLGWTSAVLVRAGFIWVLHDGGWVPGPDAATGSPLNHTCLQATTMTFLGILARQFGTAFAARTEHSSLAAIGVFSNRLLVRGIAVEIALSAAIVTIPGLAPALGLGPATVPDARHPPRLRPDRLGPSTKPREPSGDTGAPDPDVR